MYQLRTTELFYAEAEGVEFSPKAEQGKRNPIHTIKQTPRKRTLNLVEPEQRLIWLDRKLLSD